MNTFSKAYIPYNGYYSTPFCRWQGSMQHENSIELGGKTARRWFLEKKKIDPTIIDYLYFGITIHQHHMFYSHNWSAAILVDNQKNLPGLMINQACTTSTTILQLAALAIENGTFDVAFGLMADRCSNGAHSVWPQPLGPGGEVESENWMMDNFKVIGELGLPCLIHAENQSIVESGMERAIASGRVDPIAHCEFRPGIAETEATMRTIILAEGTGVHLHICHMTVKGAIEALRWAQSTGRCVTGETSPNYLILTEEDMKTKGPYAKIDPPLRKAEDQAALWKAINDGTIDVLASDHAPYPKSEKEKGWRNIFDAPSGGVGVQTSLPLMLNKVNEGRISMERLVEIFSVNPAKMLRLHPRKGTLMPGSDADLVIVDMQKRFEIREEDLYSKEKASAFAGQKGRGMPVTTVVRGNAVMKDGEILGRPGYGVYLRPQ